MLLSVIRKAVSKAVGSQFCRVYDFHPNQLGFLPNSNTENAITLAATHLRTNLPKAAVQDMKLAYDSVPRDKLLRLCRSRLPTTLVQMIQCLLSKFLARTQDQHSNRLVTMTAGVPQGDPFSPWLFKLFIDLFLESSNLEPPRMAIGFADDVLLLAADQ